MKWLVIFSFFILPAASFGQVSKLPKPFNSPFSIVFNVMGTFKDTSWSETQNSTSSIGNSGFSDSVWFNTPQDTSAGSYHFFDTLEYFGDTAIFIQRKPAANEKFVDSLIIPLDTTRTNVISELRYVLDVDQAGDPGRNADEEIAFTDLRFDSTGIFFPDSLYQNHIASLAWDENAAYLPNDGYDNSLLSVSSLDLSGIFHPTHITYPALVSELPNIGFSMTPYNGSLHCTFAPSDHLRTIELYTPLGIKAASVEVPAGNGEITLPRVASDLYFLRLENSVVKVFMR